MQLARVAPLLALLAALVVRAAPPAAHVLLPEDARNEHNLVLKQLNALGFDRFQPPQLPGQDDNVDLAERALSRWKALSEHHAEIALVWSLDAAPPLDKIKFSSSIRTRINHIPGGTRLTSARAWAEHIAHQQKAHGKFFFQFTPEYYELPRDEDAMPHVLEQMRERVKFEMKRERDPYIYQRFLMRETPKDGNDGSQTPPTIVFSLEEMQAKMKSEFQGKDVQVTTYVEPYLLDHHKFKVGFYVAVTSLDPLRIYTHSHAQVKIAKVAYPLTVDASTDPASFSFTESIAPWDFPDLQQFFYEYPSPKRTGTNAWKAVKRYMMMEGVDVNQLQTQIDEIIVRSIISNRGYFQDQIAKLQRFNDPKGEYTELSDAFFEMWRFDFEIDDKAQPFLTEIVSNPLMTPETTIVGTDEAIKTQVLFDLFNLVGVQARPSFDAFYRSVSAQVCADKCKDHDNAWNTACWSCPGWFSHPIAQRLFDGMNEYARRGSFRLLQPSLEDDFWRFSDNPMTDNDVAFNRYIKSLSHWYAESANAIAPDHAVVCIVREHCNDNGDCVNGQCRCDSAHEGATCYIPKELRNEAWPVQESWRERVGRLWNGKQPTKNLTAAEQEGISTYTPRRTDVEGFSAVKFLLALVGLTAFLVIGHRLYLMRVRAANATKSN